MASRTIVGRVGIITLMTLIAIFADGCMSSIQHKKVVVDVKSGGGPAGSCGVTGDAVCRKAYARVTGVLTLIKIRPVAVHANRRRPLEPGHVAGFTLHIVVSARQLKTRRPMIKFEV